MSVKFPDTWEPNGPFPIVLQEHIEGGMKAFEWTQGTGGGEYLNVTAALDALVPTSVRKKGALVRMKETGGGLAWTNHYWSGTAWQPFSSFAEVYGWGVVSGLAVSDAGGNVVSVGTGLAVDWYGNLYQLDDAETEALSDGTFIVYKSLFTGAIENVALSTGLTSMGHIPLAVVTVSGGSIDRVQDCRMIANGVKSKHFVSVDSGVGVNGGNFSTVRNALVWINCFADTVNNPREIRVIGDITEPFDSDFSGCISFNGTTDPFFAGACARLEGLRIVGTTDGSSGYYPKITFGSVGTEGYFLDFDAQTFNVEVAGVQFVYDGNANNANDDVCVFKTPGADFHLRNCICYTGTAITHLVYWVNGSGDVELGAYDNSTNSNGSIIEDVLVEDMVAGTIAFKISASGYIEGRLTIQSCSFVGWGTTGCYGVVKADDGNDCDRMSVAVNDMYIVGCEGVVFDIEADGQLIVSDSRFWFSRASTGAYQDVDNCGNAVISNCQYRNTQNVTLGATLYSNCRSYDGNLAVGNSSASMVNCDFGGLGHTRLIEPVHVENLTTFKSTIGRNILLQGLALEWISNTEVLIPAGIAIINGKFVRIDNGNVETTDPFTASNWFSGSVPTLTNAGDHAWGFAFCKNGETVAHFSTQPPDNDGLPQESVPVGTAADYLFIGSFMIYRESTGPNVDKILKFHRIGDKVMLGTNNLTGLDMRITTGGAWTASGVVNITYGDQFIPSSSSGTPKTAASALILKISHTADVINDPTGEIYSKVELFHDAAGNDMLNAISMVRAWGYGDTHFPDQATLGEEVILETAFRDSGSDFEFYRKFDNGGNISSQTVHADVVGYRENLYHIGAPGQNLG